MTAYWEPIQSPDHPTLRNRSTKRSAPDSCPGLAAEVPAQDGEWFLALADVVAAGPGVAIPEDAVEDVPLLERRSDLRRRRGIRPRLGGQEQRISCQVGIEVRGLAVLLGEPVVELCDAVAIARIADLGRVERRTGGEEQLLGSLSTRLGEQGDAEAGRPHQDRDID